MKTYCGASRFCFWILAFAVVTCPGQSLAADPASSHDPSQRSDVDDLRNRLNRLGEQIPDTILVSTPSNTSNVPSAFGGRWGMLGFGMAYQSKTRLPERKELVSSAILLPVGDPYKTVGVDLAFVFYDIGPIGKRGALDLKFHRALDDDSAIAFGIEQFAPWGGDTAGQSRYGVFSKVWRLRENASEPFSRMTTTFGLGDGRFRKSKDILSNRKAVNAFGAVGVNLHDQLSAFIEWTGQDVNVGASWIPFRKMPVIVTPVWADAGERDGNKSRFVVSVGYSLKF